MIELGSEILDSFGGVIQVDQVRVRSVGLSGRIKVSTVSKSSNSRSQGLDSSVVDAALKEHAVDLNYVVELNELSTVKVAPATQTRSARFGESAFEMEVPSAGENWGQAALMTDENGVASWHFPLLDNDEVNATRSGSTVTYVFPGYVAQSQESTSTRGVLGWLGKKVVRFLSFAIADEVVGEVGEFFAKRWEEKNRPYGIRSFTPDNYTDKAAEDITDSDWNDLAAGKALLFVHGTFSRASTGFGALPKEALTHFHNKYEGRVFAFDHPTLATEPLPNAQWFVDQMPDGLNLDVDIICHSRGGLVSRMFSENQENLQLGSKSISVDKLVFVAAPNAGTILANAEHMNDFVDSYTNMLNWLPDNVVTDTLAAVITVVKQIAVAVLDGLDGLQSMNPEGDFVNNVLNVGPEVNTEYMAISSDFDPTKEGISQWAQNRLMDKIFQQANDLVVPTLGVFESNGDEMFPVEKLLQLGHSDGVTHTTFFGNDKVVAALKQWL